MTYFVRKVDTPDYDETEDNRRRWAVSMYEEYIKTCTPDEMLAVKAREHRESKCRCRHSQTDGRTDIYGNEIKASCSECEK